MATAKIIAIEYALPKQTEDNVHLVNDMKLTWTANDIFSKTGIRERHIAAKEECASDLGVMAAEKLFVKYSELRKEIDALIFCSQSPDYVLPSTACLLQKRLNLPFKCASFDINQGCSGFIYSLGTAKAWIESGLAKNILIITAETYSKYIARDDKSCRPIFGDGAAAILVKATNGNELYLDGFVFGTDGNGAKNLVVQNSGARQSDNELPQLYMNGPEIFAFTLKTIPDLVNQIFIATGEQISSIDYFVFHQANKFILDHLRQKMKIPSEKFCIELSDIGNTVSASIPIALARLMEEKIITSGGKIMLVGFGVGYSWGGCVARL